MWGGGLGGWRSAGQLGDEGCVSGEDFMAVSSGLEGVLAGGWGF